MIGISTYNKRTSDCLIWAYTLMLQKNMLKLNAISILLTVSPVLLAFRGDSSSSAATSRSSDTVEVFDGSDCSGKTISFPVSNVEKLCTYCWDSCFKQFPDGSDAHSKVKSINIPEGIVALTFINCAGTYPYNDPLYQGVLEPGCNVVENLAHFVFLEAEFAVTECTREAFTAAVGSKAHLANLLGVAEEDNAIEAMLNTRCKNSLEPDIDLSDTLMKGPQFLKNFIDGGTTWNNNYETDSGYYNLSTDAAIIPTIYNKAATSAVFGSPNGGADDQYPGYFSNFYAGVDTDGQPRECRSGAMTCCYTGNRTPNNLTFVGNAEMCALDMTPPSQSNYINRGIFAYYDSQDPNNVYCTGFAYDNDSFGEAVKYNTLFHMAMKTNLYDDGYVKNIPGAPLCACVEQMPIITYAKCIKAVEGYFIDTATGDIRVNISWEDCGNLASYYESLDGKSIIEKAYIKSRIVGTDDGVCHDAAQEVLLHMRV